MREFARRGLALLLVVALVTSGAVGPVSAASTADECSTLDGFIYDVLNFQPFDENPDNPCSTQYQVVQAVEEMEQLDASQTKLDLYSATTSVVAQREAYEPVFDNYLNDSESVAWQKAQVAVAEAYQNGSSETQAKAAGRDAIEDYYTTKQVNLIEKWNVTTSSMQTLVDQANQESGISPPNVFRVNYTSTNSFSDNFEGMQADTGVSNVTLLDGSSHAAVRVQYRSVDSTNGEDTTSGFDPGWVTVMHTGDFGDSQSKWTASEFVAVHPDTGETLTYLDPDDYGTRMDRIESKSAALESEIDNYVNATYPAFEDGTVNASDVIGPTTAMFEYGTQTGNNSTLYSSTAALALMGFDTPTLNSSGMMEVTVGNDSYQGLVLARNAPGGSWEANTTYDAGNISGPVFIATATGEKIDLTGEFTITEMTAKNGESIQSQNTTKYAYKTANTSELLDVQRQLLDLRQEIEDREAAVGGGSGGSGGLDSQMLGIALLVGAAAVLLIQREGNE